MPGAELLATSPFLSALAFGGGIWIPELSHQALSSPGYAWAHLNSIPWVFMETAGTETHIYVQILGLHVGLFGALVFVEGGAAQG